MTLLLTSNISKGKIFIEIEGDKHMNQEKIGKIIKDIRTKNKMSQQKFADKYGVTYQAVSKWETGKSLPDITILKEICKDYNLDLNELLGSKKNNKKNKVLVIGLIILLLIISLFIILKSDHSFQFKTLESKCDDFNLYGSIAYNEKKSSIYISNISYCGNDANTKYKEIECTLYESDGKTKTQISKQKYNNITLEKFLKKVNFQVDNYEKTCKVYKENSLTLEIDAKNNKNKIVSYKIPLKFNDNCKK